MLKETPKSIQQLVNEQVQQWLVTVTGKKKEDQIKSQVEEKLHPSITISRQRGSGGWMIGKTIARKLDYRLFDSAILNEIAKDLKISRKVLRTIDERVITKMELWISRLFKNHYIEPSDFQHQLVQSILTIAEHGRAVFIGRAAHAIIPVDKCFRLRFVAPLQTRIANISRELRLTEEAARYDVIQNDRSRETFMLKEFGIDVSDPTHFDMIVNTEIFTCEELSDFIIHCYKEHFDL